MPIEPFETDAAIFDGLKWTCKTCGFSVAIKDAANKPSPLRVQCQCDHESKRVARLEREVQMTGVGDLIAALTKSIGIQPCDGCNRWRKTLNKWLPFFWNLRDAPLVSPDAAKAERPTLHLSNVIESVGRRPTFVSAVKGRGVVIAAGGGDLWGCMLAALYALRIEARCDLPVEVFHIGKGEADPAMIAAAGMFEGVKVIDATAVDPDVASLHPWALKPFAVIHSSFAEVLFLDADNIVAADPSFLFESKPYKDAGAIFWPDLPPSDRADWLPAGVWKHAEMTPIDEPDFESGQLVVDKRRHWLPLAVTMQMNRDADFWYRFIYGDKTTWHLAFRRCGHDYAMPATPAGWQAPAILQHDFAGDVLFRHCTQGKKTLSAGDHISGLGDLADVAVAARQLTAGRWSGALWSWRDQTELEDRIGRTLTGTATLTVGDERPRTIKLSDQGRISMSRRAHAKRWSVRIIDGVPTIVLIGSGHKGQDVAAAFLTRSEDPASVLWVDGRAGVLLAPDLPDGFQIRIDSFDRDIFTTANRMNEYGLPDLLEGATVFDIGAHIGSFALAAFQRGADRVVAVEPEALNATICDRNLRHFGDRFELHRAAIGDGVERVDIIPCEDPRNTGGHNVRRSPGGSIPTVGLAELLRREPDGVDVVKMDCEGGERVLFDVGRDDLRRVRRFVGEYHGDAAFLDRLRTCLTVAGFDFASTPSGATLGLFDANRID